MKAFAFSFYTFFRYTQFPPSACAPKNDFNKHVLSLQTAFLYQNAGVPQTDVPPLSIFSSTNKYASVELGKSFFLLSFWGKALVW